MTDILHSVELALYKDGIYDACIKGEQDKSKTYSEHYKQGYVYGDKIKDGMIIKDVPYG